MTNCRSCKRKTETVLHTRNRFICKKCGACKCNHCIKEANESAANAAYEHLNEVMSRNPR